MNRFGYCGLTLLLIILFTYGCVTTSGGGGSSKKKKKGTYAKVSKSLRGDVHKAEANLKRVMGIQKIADEILKLSALQTQRANSEKKKADLGLDIAEYMEQEVVYKIEIKKWEAIDNSALGEKEDNLKKIGKLTKKKRKLEAKRQNAEADFAGLEKKIKNFSKKIVEQERKIKKMKRK